MIPWTKTWRRGPSGDAGARAASPVRLPWLVWLVLGSTLVSCAVGGLRFLGLSLRGWMWTVPFVGSVVVILAERARRPFPLLLWAPWAVLSIGYLIVSPFENAAQRTAMVLAPLPIAYAVSGLALTRDQVRTLQLRLQQLGLLLVALMLAQVGVFTTGELPQTTGLAPQVMTGALLATVYASGFAHGLRGFLLPWAAVALLPVVAVTRTAAAVTMLTLPGAFGPLRLRKRLLALGLLALAAVAVFNTERFQQKMFYSGSGTLEDLTLENPDLRSTGRFALWEVMREEIAKKPLLGHGANAQEAFIFDLLKIRGQPHNDWLRLLFDYGWVGVGLYGLTLLAQVALLVRLHRRCAEDDDGGRMLAGATAASFVVYALIMVTDNIFLYTAYFGNLQFALIGLAYAVGTAGAPNPAPSAAQPRPRVSTWWRKRHDDAPAS
jgi:hypothetical protein